MTVNTLNIKAGPYDGNGITDEFSFSFRVENKNQLVVYLTEQDGTINTLVVDTDYTVGGIGDDDGGVITMTTPPATGESLFIRANYLYTQETDFENQGGFFPDVHERAFDKNTFLAQQIKDILDRRTLLFDDSFNRTTTQNKIPTPVSGKILAWDVDGSLINSDLIPGSTDDLDRYDSISSFISSSPSANIVYITDYRGGWAATVEGPKSGFFIHRTGGTNASPSFGLSVNVSSIGGVGDGTAVYSGDSDQAGFFYSSDGTEFKISNKEYDGFMFGAYGNGVNNDAPFINDGLTFVFNNPVKGALKLIGGYTYLLNDDVFVGRGMKLYGDGRSTDVVGTGGGIIITNSLTGSNSYAKVSDMRIRRTDSGIGLSVDGDSSNGNNSAVTRWKLEDLYIIRTDGKAGTGLDIRSSWNCTINNVFVSGWDTGVNITDADGPDYSWALNASSWTGGQIEGNNTGLRMSGCVGLSFIGVPIETNSRFGADIDKARNVSFVNGTYFEGNGQSATITSISQANPAVVTYAGEDIFSNGDSVYIDDVVGMTEVNGLRFTISNVNTTNNTFELSGINSSGYTAYSSGGYVKVGGDLRIGVSNTCYNIDVAAYFNTTSEFNDHAIFAHNCLGLNIEKSRFERYTKEPVYVATAGGGVTGWCKNCTKDSSNSIGMVDTYTNGADRFNFADADMSLKWTTLTINNGQITPTSDCHYILNQGGVSSDDLTDILAYCRGQRLVLRMGSTTQSTNIQETGNINNYGATMNPPVSPGCQNGVITYIYDEVANDFILESTAGWS